VKRQQCAMFDAVLWLTGGLLFLAGAVLAVRAWRWS
jgi:hypothetical protein